MEDLNKIRAEIHQKVNSLRNIKYMIDQESFSNLWIISDDEQKKVVVDILKRRDKLRLINWIRKHPSLELGEMGVAQLKDKARELKIPNYSRMNKVELLLAINASNKILPEDQANDLSIEQIVKEIKGFNKQMEKLFNEAGIPDEYLYLPENVEFIDVKYLIEGYEWISEIHNTVWRNAHSIKKLLPDELWERYKSWEAFEDAREVILLNEALVNLKKQVVNSNRPVLFKKSRLKSIIRRAVKRSKKND